MEIVASLCLYAAIAYGIPDSVVKRAEFTCEHVYHGCLLVLKRGPYPDSYEATCRRFP